LPPKVDARLAAKAPNSKATKSQSRKMGDRLACGVGGMLRAGKGIGDPLLRLGAGDPGPSRHGVSYVAVV